VSAAAARSSTYPGRAAHDDDRRPAADDRRVARAAVDPLGDLPELVLERAVQDARGRRDVGAEERDVEALEPAPRAEPVALALRRVDRGLPVRLDPQLARTDREAPPGSREDHRPLGEARRAALEQPAGDLRIEAADVDAVDPDAVRDRRRRAGEHESEHDRGRRERDGEEDEAAKHLTMVAGAPERAKVGPRRFGAAR